MRERCYLRRCNFKADLNVLRKERLILLCSCRRRLFHRTKGRGRKPERNEYLFQQEVQGIKMFFLHLCPFVGSKLKDRRRKILLNRTFRPHGLPQQNFFFLLEENFKLLCLAFCFPKNFKEDSLSFFLFFGVYFLLGRKGIH